MRIEHIPPPKILEKLIDYIWVTQDYHLPIEKRDDVIMPLGHLNIIFNFENAYYIKNQMGKYEPLPDVAVVGQIQSAHISDRENLKSKYYDQSHLIRTSKKLTGKTAKQLSEVQNELTLKYILNLKNEDHK